MRPRGQLARTAQARVAASEAQSVAAADGPRSSRSASGSSRASSSREEQQKKLDPILQDSRQQMQALREAPEDQRQQRGQRIREATRLRIREILTPEQQARYDEASGGGGGAGAGGRDPQSGSPGRVFIVDGEKLKPVQLTLGISDGSATEILRGDLAEGQDIVVGASGTTARPAGGQGQSAPRPRL